MQNAPIDQKKFWQSVDKQIGEILAQYGLPTNPADLIGRKFCLRSFVNDRIKEVIWHQTLYGTVLSCGASDLGGIDTNTMEIHVIETVCLGTTNYSHPSFGSQIELSRIHGDDNKDTILLRWWLNRENREETSHLLNYTLELLLPKAASLPLGKPAAF